MPNDAKLGLVLGLAVVIAIGVVFYRKDQGSRPPAESTAGSIDVSGEGHREDRSPRGRTVNRGEAGSSGSSQGTGRDGPALEAVAPDQQLAPPE